MDKVLAVEGLSKRFGQIIVADDLSFSVSKSECLGIIGPNGAGKTSVFNILDGTLRPDSGRVMLGGQDVTRQSKHFRARRGMGRAYQVPQPFPDLTAYENVLTAAAFGGGQDISSAATAAWKLMVRTGLSDCAEVMAGSLPLLDRKRLELARALALRPKVLLLDEIAGGLTEMEVHGLVELIRAIKPEVAVVWIEHVTHALSAVADRVVAIHFGREIAAGSPAEVMSHPAVQEVYLGAVLDVPAVG